MKGFFVKHTYRGIGQISEASGGGIVVQFLENGETATFDRDAFSERELARATLPLQSYCVSDGRECVIDKVVRSSDFRAPNIYEVTYRSDGLRAKVPEVDLSPSMLGRVRDPLSVLAGLSHGGYPLFHVRENLVSALNQQSRHGSGLRALLSSRIDLRPHQAYVAGVVMLDSRRRYLLADEVGLGKTIEAGIIIHDLLAAKPDAKVLVICPGALTQQWFCELYSKFGGQVFTLLELHATQAIKWDTLSKAIVSMTQAAYEHSGKLMSTSWDLVVIDETHHLLASAALYDFAHRLSRSAPSLLMLSAIPAQRREDEFLRLLGLLEPERYSPDVISDTRTFRHLFQAQRTIGRKLRLLRRRVDGLETGDFTREETITQAEDLRSLPVLEDDATLAEGVDILPTMTDGFESHVRKLLHYVGDRYRINRRIIRNRRQRLIDEEQIAPITRTFAPQPYSAEQLEYEVTQAVENLLRAAAERGLDEELRDTFARVLWQSLAHPHAIHQVLSELRAARARTLSQKGRDFLSLGSIAGYDEWDVYSRILFATVRAAISDTELDHALSCAERWRRDITGFTRLATLFSLLEGKSRRVSQCKLLIFAGFPGIAGDIAQRLRRKFGDESTTEFRTELDRATKEENVRLFRSNRAAWIMVSDETGGEGRNFQFASELIHFDNPWFVSRVEQRIGRLDRLGREKEPTVDVASNVLFDETSVEAGLVECFSKGIEVFCRSVSGLEFALREVETTIVQVALKSGRDGLMECVPDLQARAEDERARDEGEALLDEASFDRVAAERFRRVRQSDQGERELEEAFTRYLQMIASNRSVRRLQDDETGQHVWTLRGDELHQIKDPSTKALVQNESTFQGTFRRHIAQQRLDLHFFTIGHPLFEAICHTLSSDVAGRTYAIEINDHIRSQWLGFEFVFRASPNGNQLKDNIGLQNQASQLFTIPPLHLFYRIDGSLEAESDSFLTLRHSLERADKGRIWSNLTKNKALVFQDLFPSWDETVRNLHAQASSEARRLLSLDVDGAVQSACERLRERVRELKRLGADQAEVCDLQNLQAAIEDWEATLDAIGFLSINGRLLERATNARG